MITKASTDANRGQGMRIDLKPLLFAASIVLLAHSQASAQSANDSATVEIVPPIGHSSGVHRVAFSPDARWIVSAGIDGTAKLWQSTTGRLVRTFKNSVGTVTFSRNSQSFIALWGQVVTEWDIESGRRKRSFDAGSPGSSLAVSPDGRQLAIGASGTISVWDLISGVQQRSIKTGDGGGFGVAAVAYSPDGKWLASASMDTSFAHPVLEVWDVQTAQRVWSFAGAFQVSAIAFSPDSGSLVGAVAGRDYKYTIHAWNAATGRLLKTLGGTQESVQAFAFSPDGRLLISGGDDRVQEQGEFSRPDLNPGKSNNIKVWDLASGSLIRNFGSGTGAVSSLAISADGRRLVAGGDTFNVWGFEAGRLLLQLPSRINGLPAVLASPDGFTIAAQSYRGQITLWDGRSGRLIRELRHSGDPSGTISLAFSRDGSRLAAGGEFYYEGPGNHPPERLTLWDVSSGRLLYKLSGRGALTFSSDGRKLLSGGLGDKLTIKVWDAVTRGAIATVSDRASTGVLKTIGVRQDGRSIVAVSDDDVARVWESPGGRLIRSFKLNSFEEGEEGKIFGTAVLSPDRKRLFAVVGQSGPVKAFDTASGKLLWTSDTGSTSDGVSALSVSSDGLSVVIADRAGRMRRLDAENGQLSRTFGSAEIGISAVTVSPDGKRIYSGDSDTTLRHWNAVTGELHASTTMFENGEWVTITPEGFFDASANGAKLLTIVRGLEVYSIEQAYQSLYRPDLVREKLAGDPQGKVREAAAKLDLAKVMASGGAPRVQIMTPKAGAAVADEQVEVEASITEQGGGVGRIEWRVNGVTLGVETRGLARPAGNTTTVRRKLALEPGDNRIEITAYNAQGLMASEPARISVKWAGDKASLPPRLYVLAVGVNDYWDSRLKLNFAAVDAIATADALRRAGGGLYERVEVTTVLDAQATSATLDRIFSELGEKVRPRDVFVFFLAGHGKTWEGRYYFLPPDFRYRDDSSFASSGIGQDRFQEWFARIPARKSVLLYDTCESGSLIGERVALRGLERVAALEKMTRAMGRTVLSASTDDAPALEGYRGHGVFTYVLLEGLGQARSTADGLISVTDLATYIDERVPELSNAVFKMRQVPQMNIVGSNFPLVRKTAVLPATAGPPTMTTPAKPTHVVITAANVREAAKSDAIIVTQLTAGTQVHLVETNGAWVLVAREGRRLGYLAANELARLQ
jgi:WD40 repeat protein/uncharacterized caspase-like protein